MTTAAPTRLAPPATARPAVPPLRNGQRLTRAEFERRYEAMPEVKKAELIEGEVFMPSPVRLDVHGQPHTELSYWLMVYRSKTRGLRSGDNSTVRLDLDNEPQPDLLLMIPTAAGGQAAVDADGYVNGGPELVAEVSASTASIDLDRKLQAYRRNGVREYVVWRTEDAAIDCFVLQAGEFRPLEPDGDGLLKSTVFPGLWLDSAALLAGDLQRVAAAVEQGVAGEAAGHGELVRRLAAAD